MGCGSGVIPLLLLGREPSLAVCGIEMMRSPYELAKENIRENGVKAEIIRGDAMKAASLLGEGIFDLILSNPPYYPVESCRLPRNEEIAAAKAEICWDQKTMMEQAFSLLKENGCFALIFDGARKEEIIDLAKNAGFFLRRVIDIYGKEGKPQKRRLYLELTKEPANTEEDSLAVYSSNGELTPKMKRILNIYDGTGTVPCGDPHRQP